MKHQIILLLAFCLLPATASGQAAIDGAWIMEITPPGGSPITMTFEIEQGPDSLRMTTANDHGVFAMEEAAYAEERLHFVMPTGHGRVVCNVFRKEEDAFAGVCTGSMGEIVTTLKRHN